MILPLTPQLTIGLKVPSVWLSFTSKISSHSVKAKSQFQLFPPVFLKGALKWLEGGWGTDSAGRPPAPCGDPLKPSAREGDQEGESQTARAAPRGGGWASATLSQQLGWVLKQKPMSSLGVRGRSVPRGKKAMPSRLVAQLTFPEPRTEGQRMFGSGWDAVGRGRGDSSYTPCPALVSAWPKARFPGCWAHTGPYQAPWSTGPCDVSAAAAPSPPRVPQLRHTRPLFHE